MRRRSLLALIGLTASTGCTDEESPTDSETDSDEESPPFEILTVDAPGSEAGTVTIPREEQVTFLNFTRLFCPTSEGLIGTIDDVRGYLESRYDTGPNGDVRVVSAIDGSSGPDPSPAELGDWWAEHGGRWTIGIDEDGTLNDYYEVPGFPTVMAIDGEGTVHWRDTGGTTSENMIEGVEAALEASGVDPDETDSRPANETDPGSVNETETDSRSDDESEETDRSRA